MHRLLGLELAPRLCAETAAHMYSVCISQHAMPLDFGMRTGNQRL